MQTISTISPAELRRKLDEGGPVDLVDVRTFGEFEAVHAAGAKCVPVHELRPPDIVQARVGHAGEPIYFICRTGRRSLKVCERFHAHGFRQVVNVGGGMHAWENAGLDVVRGEIRTIPLERQVRITAGLLVVLGTTLGYLVHPGWHFLAAGVGAGLVHAAVTDNCGMALVMGRLPWNSGGRGTQCSFD